MNNVYNMNNVLNLNNMLNVFKVKNEMNVLRIHAHKRQSFKILRFWEKCLSVKVKT